MKKMNRILTSCILVLILAVSYRSTPLVSAESGLPQELNPEKIIEGLTGVEVTRLESGILPYYSVENELDVYQSGEFTFRSDSVSGQFIEVYPSDNSKVFTMKNEELSLIELEKLAKDIIMKLAIKVDYDLLTLQVGNKGELNYFFRWNTGSPKKVDFGKFYIQVGLTKDGQLLNLVNTLPFMEPSSGRTG